MDFSFFVVNLWYQEDIFIKNDLHFEKNSYDVFIILKANFKKDIARKGGHCPLDVEITIFLPHLIQLLSNRSWKKMYVHSKLNLLLFCFYISFFSKNKHTCNWNKFSQNLIFNCFEIDQYNGLNDNGPCMIRYLNAWHSVTMTGKD